MKCTSALLLLLMILLLRLYTGSAELTLHAPQNVYADEPTNITCTAGVRDFKHNSAPRIVIIVGNGCTELQNKQQKPEEFNGHYQVQVAITCRNGTHSIDCYSNGRDRIDRTNLKVVKKPKIITEPCNITTEAGLPVTLTCFVEGDPNHYWVGWMSRNSIIQQGQQHSISQSPSFKSTNGTMHYLTVHSIKVSGKYECKVYSMAEIIQDQISHQIFVPNEHSAESSSTSSIIWNTLSSFFST